MKIWTLEYFSIGSGTHPCGVWDGHPSIQQIMEAIDVSESVAWKIIDNKDEDYSLNEIDLPKGML